MRFIPIVVCYGHIRYISKTHSYQMKPSNIKHNKYNIYIYVYIYIIHSYKYNKWTTHRNYRSMIPDFEIPEVWFGWDKRVNLEVRAT